MRSLLVSLVALAACAETPATSSVPDETTTTARAEEHAPATPSFERTFAEPIGDATGGGLDLSDTKIAVDAEGMLVVDVAIPSAARREPAHEDNVQIYLDVDRDYEKSGYDVRIVLFGGADRPFALERWEGSRWRDRTPASYEASFDHGLHVRVLASDVGIVPAGFDLFVASIDVTTGKISDLAPDGALWERWSYSR